MTKAATQHAADDDDSNIEIAEPGSPIGRNDWRLAARELRRDAQTYRARARLAEVFETIADLESAIAKKQATIDNLSSEESQLSEKIAGARDQARKIIAEAEAKAKATLDQSAAAIQQATDELASIQEKRTRKLAELEEADRRLRDTRKSLADLRKNLASDEPAA